jgi:hypothetical protein
LSVQGLSQCCLNPRAGDQVHVRAAWLRLAASLGAPEAHLEGRSRRRRGWAYTGPPFDTAAAPPAQDEVDGEPSAHIQLQDAWMSKRIALNHMLAVVVGIAD